MEGRHIAAVLNNTHLYKLYTHRYTCRHITHPSQFAPTRKTDVSRSTKGKQEGKNETEKCCAKNRPKFRHEILSYVMSGAELSSSVGKALDMS